MEESQLLKGILEGCVLSVIARGETYGYALLAELEGCGFEGLVEGTLYPLLSRLDKRGYVSRRQAKSPRGPARNYYSITQEGRQALDAFLVSYRQVTGAADRVLFPQSESERRRCL